jgi:hypothetical protein
MNPNEFYTPPSLEINNSDPNNLGNMPSSVNQVSGFERQNNFARSVQKSRAVKQAARIVITTREELTNYLRQSNLDLLTSSVEFKETGDFVASSYVVYKDHNNFKENLSIFIERYPALKPAVQAIAEKLRPSQSQFL